MQRQGSNSSSKASVFVKGKHKTYMSSGVDTWRTWDLHIERPQPILLRFRTQERLVVHQQATACCLWYIDRYINEDKTDVVTVSCGRLWCHHSWQSAFSSQTHMCVKDGETWSETHNMRAMFYWWTTSMKCHKLVISAHHSLSELKGIASDCGICLTNSPKPQNIIIIIT